MLLLHCRKSRAWWTARELVAANPDADTLAMIGEAGLGVAYRAKPAVADAAGGMRAGPTPSDGWRPALPTPCRRRR